MVLKSSKKFDHGLFALEMALLWWVCLDHRNNCFGNREIFKVFVYAWGMATWRSSIVLKQSQSSIICSLANLISDCAIRASRIALVYAASSLPADSSRALVGFLNLWKMCFISNPSCSISPVRLIPRRSFCASEERRCTRSLYC